MTSHASELVDVLWIEDDPGDALVARYGSARREDSGSCQWRRLSRPVRKLL
jgi:hypothetical protein